MPHDIPREEEIQECAINKKNHSYNLLGWERSYCVSYLPGGTTLNSNYFVKALRSLNVCLCPLSTSCKKNINTVVPPRQNQAICKCTRC
jgi:hypothetical protein